VYDPLTLAKGDRVRLACFLSVIALTSCSFITDFDPAKSGGAGGTGGKAGSGGAGGMPRDAAIDGASGTGGTGGIGTGGTGGAGGTGGSGGIMSGCTSAAECNDGFACTIDFCDINGMCQHTPSNNRCATTNQCTNDSCDPADPTHQADGCVHTPISCPLGLVCDSNLGCVQCVHDADCQPADCCTPAHCANNRCNLTTQCGRQGRPPLCCRTLQSSCLGCLDICPL
jgi:hypothetical protein